MRHFKWLYVTITRFTSYKSCILIYFVASPIRYEASNTGKQNLSLLTSLYRLVAIVVVETINFWKAEERSPVPESLLLIFAGKVRIYYFIINTIIHTINTIQDKDWLTETLHLLNNQILN